MAWFYLFIASIFEVGWPLGFKMASSGNNKIIWITFAIIAMFFSGYFLYIAQKEIPIGTAYAVWTGIGAGCTFLIGTLIFNDTINMMKILGVIFIVTGVALLKLGN